MAFVHRLGLLVRQIVPVWPILPVLRFFFGMRPRRTLLRAVGPGCILDRRVQDRWAGRARHHLCFAHRFDGGDMFMEFAAGRAAVVPLFSAAACA